MSSWITDLIAEAGLTAERVVEGINAETPRGSSKVVELTEAGTVRMIFGTHKDSDRVSRWIDAHRVRRRTVEAAPLRPGYAEAMVTERQIAYIARLIRSGAHEEGGYVGGITADIDLTQLTRRQASHMITSMTGSYREAPEMTHKYFLDRARARFAELGGDPDNAGPLAEWAEEAKLIGDPRRGVLVAEDGALVAQTRRHGGGPHPVVVYVESDDAYRWGLQATECDLAKAQLSARTGKRIVHVMMPEVCRGAGKHVPAVPGGKPDPLGAVRRAAEKRTAAVEALRVAVADAYTAGANPTDLARAADVGRETIYRWLAAAGFQVGK